MSFEVKEAREGDVLAVAPQGRLDSVTAKDFEALLQQRLQEGERRLVLDFAGLDYVSSAGLRVVLLVGKRLKGSGGTLALAGLRPAIREVFEISGFISLFPVHPDRAAAIASLAA